MSQILKFNEFINEAKLNIPKEALQLQKLIGGSWNPDYDLGDKVLTLTGTKIKGADELQINWNSHKDFGDVEFQIADEDGGDVYYGTDPKAAAKAIKSAV